MICRVIFVMVDHRRSEKFNVSC